MDPLDNFEFKPLTEGLGFHKKAQDVRATSKESTPRTEKEMQREKLSRSSIMDTPATRSSSGQAVGFDDDDTPMFSHETRASGTKSPSKSPSKSISDLINSLPPSLDFVEKDEARESGMPTPRPQIFQPLAREDYQKEYQKDVRPSFDKPKFEAPRFEITKSSSGDNRNENRSDTRRDTLGDSRPSPTLGQVLPPPGSKATSPTVAAIAAPLVGGAAPKSSLYRASMDESLARAFPHAVARAPEISVTTETATKKKKQKTVVPLEAGLEPVAANFGSGLLDAMVVSGMSTVFLVIILAITKANLWGLLSNAQTDGPTQLHLVLLFLAVLQLYMLTARSFFGASLGEWAFDLQLGTNQEQVTAMYPLKVAWRMVLVTLTGVIVLPLASLIAGKDLTRYATGLQLYRRP